MKSGLPSVASPSALTSVSGASWSPTISSKSASSSPSSPLRVKTFEVPQPAHPSKRASQRMLAVNFRIAIRADQQDRIGRERMRDVTEHRHRPRSAQCRSSRINTSGARCDTAIRNCATASNRRKRSSSLSSGAGSGISPIASRSAGAMRATIGARFPIAAANSAGAARAHTRRPPPRTDHRAVAIRRRNRRRAARPRRAREPVRRIPRWCGSCRCPARRAASRSSRDRCGIFELGRKRLSCSARPTNGVRFSIAAGSLRS